MGKGTKTKAKEQKRFISHRVHRGHREIYYGAKLKDQIKKNVSHRGHRGHNDFFS